MGLRDRIRRLERRLEIDPERCPECNEDSYRGAPPRRYGNLPVWAALLGVRQHRA